jgi:uncharacterized membrane protein YecN with MAPEG domain
MIPVSMRPGYCSLYLIHARSIRRECGGGRCPLQRAISAHDNLMVTINKFLILTLILFKIAAHIVTSYWHVCGLFVIAATILSTRAPNRFHDVCQPSLALITSATQ